MVLYCPFERRKRLLLRVRFDMKEHMWHGEPSNTLMYVHQRTVLFRPCLRMGFLIEGITSSAQEERRAGLP